MGLGPPILFRGTMGLGHPILFHKGSLTSEVLSAFDMPPVTMTKNNLGDEIHGALLPGQGGLGWGLGLAILFAESTLHSPL